MIALPATVLAADVVTNGAFNTNLNGWTDISSGQGTAAWDGAVGGNAAGSARGQTSTGRNRSFNFSLLQSVGTINSTSTVTLSFYWYKWSQALDAVQLEMYVKLVRPAGDTVYLWSHTAIPGAGSSLSGTVGPLDISDSIVTTGAYQIVIAGNLQSGNDKNAYAQCNFDDVVLDVQAAANNAPTVTPGATQVSVSPVNRAGANTTVLSTTFSDADQPGVGAFNVTFKIREPNNTTELTLVNNQPNGGGGLTITDNGGGSYTASYTYDPDVAQTLGLYDLFFEVTDGTDIATDGYANNLDELEINQPNNAPTVTPGATQVSVSPVNRVGTGTTVISTTFSDADQPGSGAFNVTFKIREPNNTTELTLVNNQPNGGGGLTITDNGGGSYTASYTYDPGAAQTLGLYDLYFEVTDGTDIATDGYANNLDELEIIQQNAPTVTPGATQVSVSPVNRVGTNSTVISTTFSDVDQPGVGAFNVTFRIREPNNTTVLTLVNNQPNGGGGLTITDNGGGSYTASYTYDPGAAQTLGLYDLYFEVTDGIDNAIDGYANNLDELEIIQQTAPSVTAGATSVSKSPVGRQGTETTTISTAFTDVDQPGVGA
ncbi:MAG TPA: hypothetical protein VLB27_03835, partial [candidate division Zixibacteria bacterium]|nr:hypothetical protein [candidate division Zixibacteria bacterium]